MRVFLVVCFCKDSLQLKHGRLCISTRGSSSSMKYGGKPVKGSLFNEDLSLHEAGVAEGVHKVVGMYCTRADGVFHRRCFHKVASVAG
jgi:hypothetical protein